MNIQEIRQQYPQYSDLPDGQLVRGLHKKFYSDVPYADFLKKIDFREAPSDVTKEMNQGQRFTAGAGKAFYDIGQGAAQMVGAGESRDELRSRREIDRPLMRTGAGIAGNLAGNVTAFAPLAVVPGANTIAGAGALGLTAGALQPAESALGRAGNMAIGGVLGSAVQTASRYPLETLDAVGSAVSAPFKAAKAAVEPFYQSGRDQILGRAIAGATGPNAQQVQQRLSNAQTLVPGSIPTAAEVGQSGGLAALQRSAAATDPESYAFRAAQNNEARLAALQDLAGTGGQREFFRASRDATANDLYKQAYEKGVDITRNPATGAFLPKAEIAGVKGEITKLLQRPAIQEAVKDARKLAANEGVKLTDPSGSIKGLDYVKRALDDQIGKATGNEQRVLGDLKKRLLTTLDRISPKYAEARTTFAEMSKPINRMDVAQNIADRSIRPLDQVINPNQFARALSDDTVASVTGMRNATLEGVMDPQQLAALNAIREDLSRMAAAQNMARGAGSDTVQKLSMNNLMQRAGIPLGVLNMPMLGRVGNWAYQTADERLKQQLASALLSPQEAARLISLAPQGPRGLLSLDPAMLDRAALLGRVAVPAALPRD
jgi:hypothetical protein